MFEAYDIEAGHIILTSKNEYMTFSCIMEMHVMCPVIAAVLKLVKAKANKLPSKNTIFDMKTKTNSRRFS